MVSGGRLAGKRVLITGTGSGQGAAIQERFCAEGAAVSGCDITPGASEASATVLRDRGFDARGETVDLADDRAARAWVEASVDHLGGLDVLYNNASAPVFSPFAEMTAEEWRATIVNELDIVFYVTVASWPHLAKAGGAIISTASVAATRGVASFGAAAHAAAKGGVAALSRQLAAEGGASGIRSNVISPGFIDTPATESVPAEVKEWIVGDRQVIGRLGSSADIAALAVYLASDESSFVTGAEFIVDGGWTAGDGGGPIATGTGD